MQRRWILCAVLFSVVVLALPAARLIRAQVGRARLQHDHYRVKVVNELGEWARIGMIGYKTDANLRVELRNEQYWMGNLYAGERVVVAWNRDQDLIFAAEVQIDGSGTLRLQSMLPMMAAPAEGAPRAAEKRSPLPTMTIEPEN